jgi:hypothetical protein
MSLPSWDEEIAVFGALVPPKHVEKSLIYIDVKAAAMKDSIELPSAATSLVSHLPVVYRLFCSCALSLSLVEDGIASQ